MPRSVLVIDDETDLLEMLRQALVEEGYDVVGARTGAEGLSRLASMSPPPSVVLLDLMMPVMNGWDFLASTARMKARPPVVVITALSVNGVPAGADAALTKPFQLDELIEIVRGYAPL